MPKGFSRPFFNSIILLLELKWKPFLILDLACEGIAIIFLGL
jgi:hypothetical protein